MFFKRKPDETAMLLAASRASAALRTPAPRQEVPAFLQGDFADQSASPNTNREIVDFADIPIGKYLRFSEQNIPDSYEQNFACLVISGGSVVILVASDSWASHPQFSLGKRIKDCKLVISDYRRASREMIKTLHMHNVVSKSSSDQPDSETERTAWALIDEAVHKGASDVHIETRGTYAQVFFRIFGERIEQPNMSFATATEVANTIYNVHADSSSKGIAWDAVSVRDTSIEHETADGRKVTMRFSSGPIYPSSGMNFHLVIRLLIMEGAASKPLEEVGYTPTQVEAIEEMLIGAQGMVILVGPTNSGKSTSMQAMIRRIYDRRGKTIKVITIEKPVEYVLSGACQMGVPEGRKALQSDDGKDNIYTTFLKGTLRQDPDVVMVGEMRAEDEAAAVKDLVLAGRKLITTLHVYEALAVFARLREMGIPESILFMEGFISGVIYQRLVPVLCRHCSTPISQGIDSGLIRQTTFERVQRIVDLEKHDVRLRNRCGCEKCNFSGIVGRTPCAEILVPTVTFLSHLRAGNEAAARAEWHANAALNIEGWGVTAVAHGISKMVDGLLDPTDIESQIGALVVKHPTESSTDASSGWPTRMPMQRDQAAGSGRSLRR